MFSSQENKVARVVQSDFMDMLISITYLGSHHMHSQSQQGLDPLAEEE